MKVNVEKYAGLLGRVCPAAVYEYVEAEGAEADANGMKLVINSQNCIHCKTYVIVFVGVFLDKLETDLHVTFREPLIDVASKYQRRTLNGESLKDLEGRNTR